MAHLKVWSQHTLAVSIVRGLTGVCRALGFVIDIRMGFGGVVSKVGGARTPVVSKLSLGFPAAEPPEAHVHGLHFFCYDGFVGDTQGGGVVCLDGRLGLWPTHFNEGLAERNHFFGANEESSKFGLSSGGRNKFDDLCDGEDGSIVGRDRVIFRAHNVSASAAARFAGIEVGGIGVGR